MVTRKRVEYCLCSSVDSKDNDFRFQTPIRRCKPECFPVREIKNNSMGSNEGYLFSFRLLLWKAEAGIVPPILYVLIGEREMLKNLRQSLCPRFHNSVGPNTQ